MTISDLIAALEKFPADAAVKGEPLQVLIAARSTKFIQQQGPEEICEGFGGGTMYKVETIEIN